MGIMYQKNLVVKLPISFLASVVRMPVSPSKATNSTQIYPKVWSRIKWTFGLSGTIVGAGSLWFVSSTFRTLGLD